MWFPTKFYIQSEKENFIEFRERKITLFAGCFFVIIFGIAFILLWSKQNGWQEIIADGIGLTLIFLGLIPFLSNGYIFIDKQNKSLFFKGGYKRLFFSFYKISFSEISHIEISTEGKYRFGSYYSATVITLKLKNGSSIEIDFSKGLGKK